MPRKVVVVFGVAILLVWGALVLPGGGGQEGRVSGTWIFRVMLTEYGRGTAVFRQEGDHLEGTFTGPPAVRQASGGWEYVSAELRGNVGGDRIEFSFSTPDGRRATFAGTVNDAGMHGTCDYGDDERPCTWQAWRRPSVWGL